jgi:glycosyltransferase involved in cell wall biosynthesis
VQSVAALVEELGDEFEFRIATSDRDMGDRDAYPGIEPGAWTPVNATPVLYLPRDGFGARLKALLADPWHDAVYLNSLFCSRFSIRPAALVRLGLARRAPVVLAPRGELGGGALSIHRGRKRLFLAAARAAGLYEGVRWHASTAAEADEIRAWFPGARIRIALPFGRRPGASTTTERQAKRAGRLTAVFLSRISPKKNLDGALRALAGVRGEVDVSVIGPAEDSAYRRACEAIAAGLPANVRVSFRGAVAHEEVPRVFAEHDLFLFPTWGENFGQVIAEALSAGCPAILGAATPFRGAGEAGAGWVVDPADVRAITEALQRAVDAGAAEWQLLSARAREWVDVAVDRGGAIERHRALFRDALVHV